MDTYEATRIVFSRIQKRDPENASRIMGLLLIQDHGEKEMIRLAFGPEALVQSVVLQARKELGLSCPSTPSSSSPFLSHNPFSLSRQNSTSSSISSRLGSSLPSPLSIPNPSSGSSSSWGNSAFSEDIISPTLNNGTGSFPPVGPSSPSVNSFCPFYDCIGNEPMDEFQLQDHLSFLNDGSPTLAAQNQEILYPHRRSCSVSDLCLGAEDPTSGFVWKPCLYFARGYCKNGSSCKFLHGRLENSAAMVGGDGANFVGSPRNLEMVDQCQELLRSTSNQQQRLASASHLTASATFPYSASANKCLNFLLQQQQSDTQKRAAAALMTGDDLHKFGRARLDRNCFSFNGALDTNPGSRQIYLTFPADSTFREEDVSNYFSIYGPVQDVRIPYQQKRMFGFVTFVYPETVKLILAKGNPHFVCDARVLVKPYKEKGRVPDKYRKLQQVERGEFSTCNSPTGLSQRDPIDLQIGPRMFYNNPDMLWRRKLEEQVDLQQALEIQNRRLMGLQLDEKHRRHHHHRALSMGGFPLASPTYSSNFFDQSFVVPSNPSSPETPGEISSSDAKPSSPASATNLMPQQNVNGVVQNEGAEEKEKPNDEGSGKASSKCRDSDLSGSLEHNLPDSLFASPKKAAGECATVFTNGAGDDTEKNSKFAFSSASSPNDPLMTSTLLPASSTLDLASLKSCYFQVPRFPGHGAIGM